MAGEDGMSSDEEDPERPGIYVVSKKLWRSDEWGLALRHLDVVYKDDIRGTSGSVRRPREDSNAISKRLVVPQGLPRNCYNQDWLSTLHPDDLEATVQPKDVVSFAVEVDPQL